MKQVNKTFDTVKVFRGIKTQLSEKLSNMNDAEVNGYLATYNETYYNLSIAETRLKYKDVIALAFINPFAIEHPKFPVPMMAIFIILILLVSTLREPHCS